MIALLTACLFFCNPCACAELHQQKRARKLCSATLRWLPKHRGKMHCAWVQILASSELCISGYVLKSSVNKIKARTVKFDDEKWELEKESRGKVCLVEKFIFHLSFKRLHQGVWCLHQQQNMREFQVRSHSARGIFLWSSSCCVGLVVWFLPRKMWQSQQKQP